MSEKDKSIVRASLADCVAWQGKGVVRVWQHRRFIGLAKRCLIFLGDLKNHFSPSSEKFFRDKFGAVRTEVGYEPNYHWFEGGQ